MCQIQMAQRFGAPISLISTAALAAELQFQSMANKTSPILRSLLSVILIALAANCFLKYLWWTASYSAWSSIPKMADQAKAAGWNATFNGWSFFVLDATAVIALFSLIRLRDWSPSGLLKTGVRLALSLVIAIAATGVFVLALSWIKQVI
jgi:hypothetical protein